VSHHCAVTLRKRCRRARCRDFDRIFRAKAWCIEPEGWLLWNVHPFADERELLARLELTPDSCTTADAYWRTRADVYFVQIIGPRVGRPCIESRRGPRGMLTIILGLAAPEVEFGSVIAALRRAHALGLPRTWSHRSPARLGSPTKLG
jgi:hypothetical protein